SLRPAAPPDLASLSLHDALPISLRAGPGVPATGRSPCETCGTDQSPLPLPEQIGSCAAKPRRGFGRRLAIVQVLKSQPSLGNRRSEEHTSELQSRFDLVCRLLLE